MSISAVNADPSPPNPERAPSRGLRIGSLAEAGAAWDRFVAGHPAATAFHLEAWQRAVERTFHYEPHSLAVWRGDRVAGVLPLFRVPTLPWGNSLVSAPQAVYGGPLADGDDARDALLVHAHGLGERLGSRYVQYRNVEPLPNLAAQDLYVTFRKNILPTADENLALVPRNQRRSIRIGQKSDLTAEMGREEFLDPFYDLYSESLRNLGTPSFPRSLFANVFEAFGANAGILLIRRHGTPVASVLTLFFRDQILPYYGAAKRDAQRYGVNDYMYWSLLLHGMEHGYKVFDFGRSKKGSGSYDFKRHWGFEPTPLHYQYDLVRQRSLPDLSPRNPKFSAAIEVWKRMPLWLSRRLGPALIRYFP